MLHGGGGGLKRVFGSITKNETEPRKQTKVQISAENWKRSAVQANLKYLFKSLDDYL